MTPQNHDLITWPVAIIGSVIAISLIVLYVAIPYYSIPSVPPYHAKPPHVVATSPSHHSSEPTRGRSSTPSGPGGSVTHPRKGGTSSPRHGGPSPSKGHAPPPKGHPSHPHPTPHPSQSKPVIDLPLPVIPSLPLVHTSPIKICLPPLICIHN